jgi:hypothetical protein
MSQQAKLRGVPGSLGLPSRYYCYYTGGSLVHFCALREMAGWFDIGDHKA